MGFPAAAGAKPEEGLAVLNAETQTFDYTATAANGMLAGSKITAFAKDLPRNVAEREINRRNSYHNSFCSTL
jgi:hypothetical protein